MSKNLALGYEDLHASIGTTNHSGSVASHAEEMTMCKQHFLTLYNLFLDRHHNRILFIDQWARSVATELRHDDEKRNEQDIYKRLFSDECRSEVVGLYEEAMRELGQLSYVDGGDI